MAVAGKTAASDGGRFSQEATCAFVQPSLWSCPPQTWAAAASHPRRLFCTRLQLKFTHLTCRAFKACVMRAERFILRSPRLLRKHRPWREKEVSYALPIFVRHC